jgi:hypothetical protein
VIDTEALADFERGYSKVLDALEQLKRLEPPAEADGAKGVAKWFRDFRHSLLTLATASDPERLARFGEELDVALADAAERAGQAAGAPSPYPHEGGLLQAPVAGWAKVTARKKNAAGAAYTNWATDQTWVHHIEANPCNEDGTGTDADVTLKILASEETDPAVSTGYTETSLANDTVVLYVLVPDQDWNRYLVPAAGRPTLEVAIA